jgi:head-tail adaptor
MPNNAIPLRKRAGQLRHRIKLQAAVEVEDETGGKTETWPTFAFEQAAIDGAPFVVSETQATVLYQVSLRYRADVIEKFDAGTQLRVVGNGKTLKVLALVNAEERNRDLVLHCGRVNDE